MQHFSLGPRLLDTSHSFYDTSAMQLAFNLKRHQSAALASPSIITRGYGRGVHNRDVLSGLVLLRPSTHAGVTFVARIGHSWRGSCREDVVCTESECGLNLSFDSHRLTWKLFMTIVED